MDLRLSGNGDGPAKQKLIQITIQGEGCVTFEPAAKQPPPKEELPIILAQALMHWLKTNPVRVRSSLPITKDGNTIALLVWFDRTAG